MKKSEKEIAYEMIFEMKKLWGAAYNLQWLIDPEVESEVRDALHKVCIQQMELSVALEKALDKADDIYRFPGKYNGSFPRDFSIE
jgi:hypothetical protein